MRDRFPLKEKFNNAISDGTIPTVFPSSPFNAAVEHCIWDIKPASALEAISKEFADTELFRVAVSSARGEKRSSVYICTTGRTTGGVYLVLAPTLSQLRSWL